MSDVSLTSGMKSALLSMQSTQKLYDKTQERLTSGLKVAKPSDDPAAYYAAATLNDRASALEGRLDNMDQAVEAISAADNGISSMTSVLSSMTAIVESALSSSSDDTDTRAALGKKFNDLLRQLSTMANDSAYGGVNLLDGQDITVQMGENYNDSTFVVKGFFVAGVERDPDKATGEIDGLVTSNIPTDWGTSGAATATNFAFALNMVENPTAVVGIQSYGMTTATNTSGDGWEVDWTSQGSYQAGLSTVLSQIEQVKDVLETRSKLLSFDQSTITLRQNYTSEFVNTLQEGADSLTLADLNEESANLLSLETSQSLAVQAMSLSNQQLQGVLRLLQ
jgi:flagellin-like hook-associated protein FlgL